MKHTKTAPCVECPFRKTALAGYLGPDTVQEVIRKTHGEGGYTCHMHVSELCEKLGEDVVPMDDVEQCAGAIISANMSHKLYKPGPLRDQQDRLPQSSKQVMNVWQFKEHHENGEKQWKNLRTGLKSLLAKGTTSPKSKGDARGPSSRSTKTAG